MPICDGRWDVGRITAQQFEFMFKNFMSLDAYGQAAVGVAPVV